MVRWIVSNLVFTLYKMFEKYLKDLEKWLIDGINEWLNILEKDIEAKSPVDTGKYISWNKRRDARRLWNNVVGEVYNDSENWYNVEYWFRKRPVNRHKNRKSGWPVIYTGVGARTYSRAYDEKQKKIQDILQAKINKVWT